MKTFTVLIISLLGFIALLQIYLLYSSNSFLRDSISIKNNAKTSMNVPDNSHHLRANGSIGLNTILSMNEHSYSDRNVVDHIVISMKNKDAAVEQHIFPVESMTTPDKGIGEMKIDKLTHSRSNSNSHSDSNSSNAISTHIQLVQSAIDDENGDFTLLLIICSNRPEYLKETLDLVVRYHPKSDNIPILISEDGSNMNMLAVIDDARHQLNKLTMEKAIVPLIHVHHPIDVKGTYENGYFKLSAHYKWALNEAFSTSFDCCNSKNVKANRVIILEEDLKISPDFFEYFTSLAPLLDDKDENLMAISAWNDNGLSGMVQDSENLMRSDFFPGLGWMLNRAVFVELYPKWPVAYWDDWLREPKQRRDRHFIRPEVCRTFHIGKKGVSNAQFSEYLDAIQLNDRYVEFSKLDLSYLSVKTNSSMGWNQVYYDMIKQLPVITISDFDATIAAGAGTEVRIGYRELDRGVDSFVSIARWSGAMDNIKANVPRTAYKGIVSIWKDSIKLHITPSTL